LQFICWHINIIGLNLPISRHRSSVAYRYIGCSYDVTSDCFNNVIIPIYDRYKIMLGGDVEIGYKRLGSEEESEELK